MCDGCRRVSEDLHRYFCPEIVFPLECRDMNSMARALFLSWDLFLLGVLDRWQSCQPVVVSV